MKKIVCFVSHTWAGNQHSFAKQFAKNLRRFRDLDVWIDEEQVSVSDNLQNRLTAGLTGESDCCIVLLSPEYLKARTAPTELEKASLISYEIGKPLFIVIIKQVTIPLNVNGLFRADFSDAVDPNTLVPIEPNYSELLKKLAKDISKRCRPASDILSFFSPPNGNNVILVSNLGYEGPHPYKDGVSTTTEFRNATIETVNLLKMRGAVRNCHERHSNRLSREVLTEIMASDENIVSYASSKINLCTELMLNHVSSDIGMKFGFIPITESGEPALNVCFPTEDKNVKCGLAWGEEIYLHDKTLDHALIMRFTHASDKVWWVIAGCGRPGSVAARKLVFEPKSNPLLWNSLGNRWKANSFIARVKVRHDRENNPKLAEPEDIEVVWI